MRGGEYFFFGGGGHLIFRRTREGSVVTEDPKGGGGGSLKTLEGFKMRPLKFAWKMKTWGGDRESYQMLLGRVTSLN